MKIFSLPLLIVLCGCELLTPNPNAPYRPHGRVQVATLDPTPRSLTANLALYSVAKPPPSPYHVIALLTAEGEAKEEAALLNYMTDAARHYGADAIVTLWSDVKNSDESLGNPSWHPNDRRVFRLHAIVFDK